MTLRGCATAQNSLFLEPSTRPFTIGESMYYGSTFCRPNFYSLVFYNVIDFCIPFTMSWPCFVLQYYHPSDLKLFRENGIYSSCPSPLPSPLLPSLLALVTYSFRPWNLLRNHISKWTVIRCIRSINSVTCYPLQVDLLKHFLFKCFELWNYFLSFVVNL